MVKNLSLQCRRPGFNVWVRKIPWRWEWLPTPVFLPGEFHEQRSLAGYSPWSRKGLDMTEELTHTIVTEGLSTREQEKKIKHIQIEKEEVKHFIKN